MTRVNESLFLEEGMAQFPGFLDRATCKKFLDQVSQTRDFSSALRWLPTMPGSNPLKDEPESLSLQPYCMPLPYAATCCRTKSSSRSQEISWFQLGRVRDASVVSHNAPSTHLWRILSRGPFSVPNKTVVALSLRPTEHHPHTWIAM